MVKFQDLPSEVHAYICRQLDPIGLISASQTCQSLRNLITPTRTRLHFVQQLLQLESTEKYGGPSYTIRARDNHLEPPITDNAWKDMRWACSGCLRLLPHYSFDNCSIFRLKSRKLHPKSYAAEAYSSWEMSKKQPVFDHRRPWKWDPDLRVMWWRQYELATQTYHEFMHDSSMQELLEDLKLNCWEIFGKIDWPTFKKLTPAERFALLDLAADDCERILSGGARHRRKCNECRFLTKSLGLQSPKRGTARVPIMPSRPMRYDHGIDRFFPGVMVDLFDHERPATRSSVIRGLVDEMNKDSAFSLSSVRCPDCQMWKELRAFRVGNLTNNWALVPVDQPREMDHFTNWDATRITTDFINNMQCNACYREKHGAERLGRLLVLWLRFLIRHEMRLLQWMMADGMRPLMEKAAPKKYAKAFASIKRLEPNLRASECIFSRDDVAFLKHPHDKWEDLLMAMQKDDGCAPWWPREAAGQPLPFVNQYKVWVEEWDVIESNWQWLKSCDEDLESKADELVKWAIERDLEFVL